MKINNKEINPLEQGFLLGLLSKEKVIIESEIRNEVFTGAELEATIKHLDFVKQLQKKLWFYS